VHAAVEDRDTEQTDVGVCLTISTASDAIAFYCRRTGRMPQMEGYSVTSVIFVSPKVGASRDPVDSWYRYYAGYSASFVEQALNNSAAKARLVLDPWNGTGTTTVVAASNNVAAVGFDVNPALVVIARARLLGAGVWASIEPLGADVVAHATSVRRREDPLRFWFTPKAAASIRGLQQHHPPVGIRGSTIPVGRDDSPRQGLAARDQACHYEWVIPGHFSLEVLGARFQEP
jgi:hypothetical protein